MAYSLSEAFERVKKEKGNYDSYLKDKDFIFLFQNPNNSISMIQVQFIDSNYLHLTGLDYQNRQSIKRTTNPSVPTNAKQFYQRLGTDDTLLSDISFIQEATPQKTRKTYRDTQRKLNNLPRMTHIPFSASSIGKSKDNTISLFVSRKECSLGIEKKAGKLYFPKSLRDGAISDFATDIKPIVAIFVKPIADKTYKLTFLNKSVRIQRSPFDADILENLSFESFKIPPEKVNAEQLTNLIQAFSYSIRRKMRKTLSDLSQLRESAYDSDDNVSTYLHAVQEFLSSLDCKEKCDIAIELLTVQNKETPNDLIGDEIAKINQKFQQPSTHTMAVPETDENIRIVQFTTPSILPSPSGAVAIPSPMDNLVKGLSDAAEKLHNFFASFLPKPKRSPRPRTSVMAEQPRSPEQSEPESEPPRQDAPKAFAVRRSQIKEIAGKQAETPHVQRSRDKKQNIEQ